MQITSGYERIVFFGDSWTDAGVMNGLVQEGYGIPILNPFIYQYGRFGNGLKHADYLADHLGVVDDQVENYAIGGARVLVDRTFSEFIVDSGGPEWLPPANGSFRVDLAGQIDRYLAGLDPLDDLSSSAVSLLIGGNDLANIEGWESGNAEQTGQDYASSMVDAIYEQADRVVAAGFGDVFLFTLPDFTELPFADDFPDEMRDAMSAASDAFNAELLARQGEFEALGSNVTVFDFANMFEEVAGDYTSFGFRTFDEPIALGEETGFVSNPANWGVPHDQIALTDGIHTSDAFEQILARLQIETLTSDVQFGGSGNETFTGGGQDDLIVSRDGNDQVSLGAGNDVGFGGVGEDTMFAGAGDDLVGGGSGDDLIFGGDGNDVLADNHGDDLIEAGSGNDIVIDGAGSDVAIGGVGDDVFIFTDQKLLGGDSSSDLNVFVGGEGNDTLILRLDILPYLGYATGLVTLDDLGIHTHGIENIEVVLGLDIESSLPPSPLFEEADQWGLI